MTLWLPPGVKALTSFWHWEWFNEVEYEFHFYLQCRKYKDFYKELTYYLISTENINLTLRKRLEKLKLLFARGSWGSLNALGKTLCVASKKREQKVTQQCRLWRWWKIFVYNLRIDIRENKKKGKKILCFFW